MINNDTAKSIYTVTEGVTEYPIGFQYMWDENNQPQILVYVGPEANRYLEYGTDFTVSDDGLSIVLSAEIEAGTKLSIMSDVPFIQDSDYVVGRIDPEQIERDFDKSVLRDLQLRDYADDINDRLADEVQARTDADAALQDAIDDEVAARSLADTTLQDNIDAEADAREDADDALQAAINTKQDVIADLATIRSGAAAGATAVQPSDLATVATTGSYNDLSNRPTIPATAADVHALPDTTKYGASLALSVNPATFVVTAQLKDQNNSNLGTPQTIDLPLESVVVSGTYDATTKEVVLTLESGSTIRFSVADLVSGLQTEITSVNMLDADLVDDTSSVHKFVTAADKTSWDNKVSKSGDTMTGDLNMGANDITFRDLSGNNVSINSNGQVKGISINGDIVLANSKVYSKGSLAGGTKESGTSSFPWDITHTKKINNGADIAVPTSGGTMARVEDLPDVSHMVTDNTAQSITAVKTLVSASASNTTPQVILANYAVKFGTSGNNDLFSISANANTSTLSIVGDNASNTIDIAASGAVLNHLQVTSSDVTFGGNSLINPGVMTGADGTNAGTSGLVPAPAATDNDKFLSGDGTWKPVAESTGIEWKTKVDLPAEYTGDAAHITPYYTITGGLPDGTYEFYFSTKATTDSDYFPLGEVIFKAIVSIDNTNATFYGRMGYVFDGNYMNDGNYIFGDSEKQLYTLVFKNGSDMILYGTDFPWASDVFGYITPRLVPECFKLSAIKNVDTGDEYIATGAINLDGSWPAYTMQYGGFVKLTQLVNAPSIPSTTGSFAVTAADFATKTILLVKTAVEGSIHLDTYGSELIINFTGAGGNQIAPYSQEIVRATGIFSGCYLAYGANYIYVMGVDTTTAATLSGTVDCACSGLSNSGMAMWFDTVPAQSLTPLAQFGPQAYRLGTITADGVGNIVQYTGATDANYTNGYFYKANGTLVQVPASITFTNFAPSDITVTVANPDALITALNNVGGWGEQWVRDNLALYTSNFALEYDFGTGTVIKVWWANYGDMYQQDVLDCFAVSTTGSYSEVLTIGFDCNSGYTPGHNDVTNTSWDRVDVQPASSGGSYTAGNGISIDANNEISVADTVVTNSATQQTALAVGSISNPATASSSAYWATVVGPGTSVTASDGVAVGAKASVGYSGGIAIGPGADVSAAHAIQISSWERGARATNNVANTVNIANGISNYRVLEADGTIPAGRHAALPSTDGTYVLKLVITNGVPTLSWVAE